MPTFDLGLVKGPKGDTGQRGEKGIQGPRGYPAMVNGISPDDSGNIALSAGDVGAYTKDESNTLLANKAPAGYGLGGGSKLLTASDDLNTISASGWYYWRGDKPQNAPTDYSIMRVDTGADGNIDWCRQTVMMGSQSTKLERCCVGASESVWQPWEYANPPMELGVEYRTTERHLGKPVYVKTFDAGAIPNNSVKLSSFQNENVIDKIVSCLGYVQKADGTDGASLPCHSGSAPNINTLIICHATPSGRVQITTWGDHSGWTDTCFVTVKYTKLTD